MYISAKYPEIENYFYTFLQTQWWTPDRISELQVKKLRKLIDHAYRNVPYYREIMDKNKIKPEDIKSKEDLKKLPITDSATMKKNFRSGKALATNIEEYFPKKSHSSGSTGSPIINYRGRVSRVISGALMKRFHFWMGINSLNCKEVLLWGRPYMASWIQKRIRSFRRYLNNITQFDTHGWDTEDYLKCLTLIKKTKPDLIRGYAASIFLLGKIAKEHNIYDVKPKSVCTTAQTLFPEQRKVIEESFKTKVYDQYGGSECHMIACECDTHESYHIQDEHVIVELLESKEFPSGIKKIIITDLDNYAQPFIRYENGDLAETMSTKCSCGRGLSTLKSIIGRTQDIIRTKNGHFFSMHPFTGLFLNFDGIDHFQIIQKTKESILIKIVKNNNLIGKDLKIIKTKLNNLLKDSLSYSIEFVDHIPKDISGKHKIVISEVNYE